MKSTALTGLILVAIIGLGVLWFTHKPVAIAPTSEPEAVSVATTNEPVAAPSISVTDWKKEGPATITVSYANLPARTSGLALCADDDKCTEWVEDFHPATPTGTYTMSTTHQYADSMKGLLEGPYRIVVIGTEFADQIVSSDVFTVK